MSLIAWYPLNGDTLDYSGNGRHATNAGATINDNGKIGKCYQFSNDSSGINIPNNNFIGMEEYTMSAWVNPKGIHRNYNGVILSSGNWNSGAWSFGLSQDNDKIDVASNGYNIYINYAVPINKWTHILATMKGNIAKIYANGSLIGTRTAVGKLDTNASNTFIGRETYSGGHFSFNGELNDIRIYDHELSAKEVKEIAKAKILHYKFDDFQEPTVNLLIDGEIPITSSSYAIKNYYFREPMIDGGVYTLSIKGQLGDGKLYFGPYNSGGSVNLTTLRPGDQGADGIYRKTFNWIVGTSSNTYMTLYQMLSTTVVESTVEWIQLEKKGYSTLFTPNSRNGIVRDCSGYGNDAILDLPTTPTWTNDSKIGVGAYKFNGSTNHIELKSPLTVLNDNITVSMWVKFFDDSRGILLGDHGKALGVSLNIEKNTSRSLRFYWGGSPDITTPTNALPLNEWCLVTVVKDKDNQLLTMYVNAVSKQTYSGSLSNKIIKSLHSIGRDSRTGATAMNGLIDDVRIYATALSAEDVKELYQTRASVDSKGNFYSNAFNETRHRPLTLDYTVWEDGQTGSVTPFTQYGNSNRRVLGSDPWGKRTVLWESFSTLSTHAGGILINSLPIDSNKMYRFSVWERRLVNGATYANYYFGLNGYGSVNGVTVLSTGAINTNPYFTSGSRTSALVNNMLSEWVLVVGYVYPHNYAGVANHADAGWYNVIGKRLGGTTSFKWLPETTSARYRTYAIYRTGTGDSTGAIHHSVYPRMDICDGTEPSITELLHGFDSRYIEKVRLKKNGVIGLDIGDNLTHIGEIREVGIPIRYIRDTMSGSTANSSNHWVEIQAYDINEVNIALGKSASNALLTDGSSASSPYYSGGQATVDLGGIEIVNYLKIWHYWADGRTYHNVKTEVSADNVNWTTVFDSNIDGEYKETSLGNTIILTPNKMSIDNKGNLFVKEISEV